VNADKKRARPLDDIKKKREGEKYAKVFLIGIPGGLDSFAVP
jgi:hypothetical protein